MGVKLLSAVDRQITWHDTGKQFSTCKYKKAGKILSVFLGMFLSNLYILGARNYEAQIKGLVNYCQWQKKLFLGYDY